MWASAVLIIFAGCAGFTLLIRNWIRPSDVQLRLSREEDLRVCSAKNGNLIIWGKTIRCEYIQNADNTEQFIFKAGGRKGKIVVDYDADGRLAVWQNGATINGGYFNRQNGPRINMDIWLFESVRGTILNAIETARTNEARPHA